MDNSIVNRIAIRGVTDEDINGTKFAKIKATFLDDGSESDLWIPADKVKATGLDNTMVENRQESVFPEVEVTFEQSKYKRNKLSPVKFELVS